MSGSCYLKKILVVFGTRPEAIKLAPLILALKSLEHEFEVIVCVTGQHREMLDQVLEVFNIKPNIDLCLMSSNQGLPNLTSSMLVAVGEVIKDVNPELVLVHGDTTTTFATAVACFYSGTPLGHIEAGLRTRDLSAPFPEEFNRQVVSKLADFHFAPTETCRNNLLSEGVSSEKIFLTGNTVIDALNWTLAKVKNDLILSEALFAKLDLKLGFYVQSEKFVMITGHRRENFGTGFREICGAILDLAERYPEIRFVYPVHLNPNVWGVAHDLLGSRRNIHLIEPLDYLSFSVLLQKCYFVLTDSGGIQEEAPSLGKPVLLMRETTERPEGVMAGTSELVGADRDRIVRSASRLIDDTEYYSQMAKAINPFGSGDSVERIINCLLKL
jgi:UDP-N-acetylglucosamine 2-epimerase (non-hydrolysing)